MFLSKKKSYTLTPTQELLLSLLRAQLWQRSVDDIVLPSSIEEWDTLMNLAYKQTVICFICAACLRHKDANFIPEEIRHEMQDVIEENKKIHKHHNEVLLELITFFEGHGLHPILLKGQGIAQMYPEPELRQCGDIDLYFCPEEYEHAKCSVMKIEGLYSHKKESYKHFEVEFNDIHVEIHRHTCNFPNPFVNNDFQKWTVQSLKMVSKISICEKIICIPSAIYNIVYVFSHMWHHFENGGISLRQLCDLVVMNKHYSSVVDYECLRVTLNRFSSFDYFLITKCLFEKYFMDNLNDYLQKDYSLLFKACMMMSIVFDTRFSEGFNKNCYNHIIVNKRITKILNLIKNFKRLYPICGNKLIWRYYKIIYNVVYRLIIKY